MSAQGNGIPRALIRISSRFFSIRAPQIEPSHIIKIIRVHSNWFPKFTSEKPPNKWLKYSIKKLIHTGFLHIRASSTKKSSKVSEVGFETSLRPYLGTVIRINPVKRISRVVCGSDLLREKEVIDGVDGRWRRSATRTCVWADCRSEWEQARQGNSRHVLGIDWKDPGLFGCPISPTRKSRSALDSIPVHYNQLPVPSASHS